MKLEDQSTSLERQIISYLFVYPKDIIEATTIINEDDFIRYGKHFNVLLQTHLNDKNITLEIAKANLFVSDFIENIPFQNIGNLCRELKEISRKRKIKSILHSYTESNSHSEEIVAEIQSRLINTISENGKEESDAENIIKKFETARKSYQEKNQKLIGISTGYEKLDAIIDGLRPEHFWVIGAYTSHGKSFAALNITKNLIEQKKRVVIYSLEMSQVDLLSRLVGIFAKHNGTEILKGKVVSFDEKYFFQKIVESGLSIHNDKYEISQIILSMYEETLKKPVDLFVIDFIQNAKVKGMTTEYETMTEIALQLQQASRRFKIPILALSQISNEGARQQESDLMMFKGTGAIASASDLAIQIVKGEEDKAEFARKISKGEPVKMLWLIKKNRHGRVGSIEMEFDGRNGIFKEHEDTMDGLIQKGLI